MGNNSTIAIPAYHFFLVWEESILGAVLILIILMALYGNCGLLYVLYQNDKMWTSTYLIIGNLAAAGVLISIISMPFSLAAVVVGHWPLDGMVGDTVCTSVGFVNSLLLNATIFTHTMNSILKYFAVVKPFSRAMSVKRTRQALMVIWLLAAILSSGPLFKVGRYAYGSSTMACGIAFPRQKSGKMYLLILAVLAYILPIVIMVFVYINVCMSVRKHSRRLANTCSCENVVDLQKKVVFTALTSLACFILCWSPFSIFVLKALRVQSKREIPRTLGVSAYWCGFSYNALNPIIIGTMNRRFGEGLRDVTLRLISPLLRCCCLRKRRHRKHALQEPIEMQNVFTEPSPHLDVTCLMRNENNGKPVGYEEENLLTVPSDSPELSSMTMSLTMSSSICSKFDLAQ